MNRKLLRTIVYFSGTGLVAIWLITQFQSAGVIRIGGQAPEFTLGDESGGAVRLSDYRGKLVFLNFWATWCLPCIQEMPEMEHMAQTFRDREFQMLAVSIDHDWRIVRKYLQENNLSLKTLLDPGQHVARNLYRATGWPETFLVGPDGSVVKHFVGRVRWSDPEVVAMVESLIPANDPVPVMSRVTW